MTKRKFMQNYKSIPKKDRQEWSHRWYHVIDRCYNPKHPQYKDYGGRGIAVDDRYLNMLNGCYNFYKDCIENIGDRPSSDHSIDRIDNDGDYTIDNLKWSTYKEQANNRRPRKLTKEDVKEIMLLSNHLTQKKIAKIYGVSQMMISYVVRGKRLN